MKQIVSLLLVVVMCLSLCACKNDATPTKEERDPLLGKWEAHVGTRVESTYEFVQGEDGIITGTWTAYNHDNGDWIGQAFTLKSRTESLLNLLLANGEMHITPYTFLGHQLYISGILHTNSEVTLSDDTDTSNLMLHNGENYEIYTGIYIGLHYDSLKEVYPELSELDENSCAKLENLGKFDYAYFYFSNGFLYNVRLSEYDDEVLEEFINSFIQSANADFGEYTFSSKDEPYLSDNFNYYEWKLEKGEITLTVAVEDGETVPWRVSVDYGYY